MLPTGKLRPVWASNANYATGAGAGLPNKNVISNLDFADGARPGEQPSPRKENYWRNDIDAMIAKLRSLAFCTTTVQAITSTISSVWRRNGAIWCANGTVNISRNYDGGGTFSTNAYAGEGGTARFTSVLGSDDGRAKWVLGGVYTGAGSIAAGAFGLWEFDPAVGTVTPLIQASHALPWVAPSSVGQYTFLVRAYGGKAYCFRGPALATNKFVRVENVGADPDYFDMYANGDADSGSITADRISGKGNNLIHVFQDGATFQYDLGQPGTPWNWTRFDTGIPVGTHGKPLCVRYVPGFDCYVCIMADGTVYQIPLVGGAPVVMQGSTGHTFTVASISDFGWFAYAGETAPSPSLGVLYYSPDFLNVYTHPAEASGPFATSNILFDSESWWFPVTGFFGTYLRTLPIV